MKKRAQGTPILKLTGPNKSSTPWYRSLPFHGTGSCLHFQVCIFPAHGSAGRAVIGGRQLLLCIDLPQLYAIKLAIVHFCHILWAGQMFPCDACGIARLAPLDSKYCMPFSFWHGVWSSSVGSGLNSQTFGNSVVSLLLWMQFQLQPKWRQGHSRRLPLSDTKDADGSGSWAAFPCVLRHGPFSLGSVCWAPLAGQHILCLKSRPGMEFWDDVESPPWCIQNSKRPNHCVESRTVATVAVFFISVAVFFISIPIRVHAA